MKNKILYILLAFTSLFFSCVDNEIIETEYKVEHLLQTADCTDYILTDTDILSGFIGDFTKVEPAEYEGFEPLNFQQSVIEDSTVVKIKYDRKKITYTLNIDGVTRDVTGPYGTKVEEELPEKTGFVFCGWTSGTEYYDEILFSTESGQTFTAVYLSSESSFYTVHHFFENIENDSFTENALMKEIISADTGTKTNAKAKIVSGFSPQSFEQKTVSSTGTEISIYYKRNIITFTFTLDGGTGNSSISKKYGTSTANIAEPVRNGSEFSGWTPELTATFEEDGQYTATWDMPYYTAEYWFENTTDGAFEKNEALYPDKKVSSLAGTKTDVLPFVIAGFQPLEVIQEVVKQDNSTVVKIYYTRKIVTLYVDLNGGSGLNYIQGKYGTSITTDFIDSITRTGYRFDTFESELPLVFDYADEGKTVTKINWIPTVEEATYSVRILYENLYDDGYTDQDIVYRFKGKVGEMTQVYQGEDSKLIDESAYMARRNNIFVGSTVVNPDSYHYLAEAIENKEILADNSTVVNLKIRRGRCKLIVYSDYEWVGQEQTGFHQYVFEGKTSQPLPCVKDLIRLYPINGATYNTYTDWNYDGEFVEKDGDRINIGCEINYDEKGNLLNMAYSTLANNTAFPAFDCMEKIEIKWSGYRKFNITIDPNGHAKFKGVDLTSSTYKLKNITSPKVENNILTGKFSYVLAASSGSKNYKVWPFAPYNGYTMGKFATYYTVDDGWKFIGWSEYPDGKDENGNDAIYRTKDGSEYSAVYHDFTLYAQYEEVE